MRVSLQKFKFILISMFLCTIHIAYSQPVWDSGFPALQSEARSIGLRVNLDRKSQVYYIVYRVTGAEPASGSLTAAQIRNPGTAPGSPTTSGNFAFGDASYCRITPPGCSAIDGDVTIERVVSISLAVNGSYRVFFTAQDGGGPLTAPVDRTIATIATDRCFKPGSNTVIPDKFIGLATINVCSPSQVILTVRYTGVDWTQASLPVRANINFGDDGNTGTLTPLTLLNSPLGTPELNKAFRVYEGNINKTYDYSLGDNPALNPTGSGCTFKIDADLGTCRLSGAATDLTTTHTVWDDPGTVRGQQNVNPDGPDATDEEFEVCEGNRTAVNLIDASEFNCTVVEEARQAVPLPASPNYESRWVQWVYGVAGTNVTTGAAANEKVTINGVDFNLADFPIYGPVEYLASPAQDPWSLAYPIQMPTSATVGQRFVVQLRSWNTCRQYDNNTGDGNGLNPSGGTNSLGTTADNKWFTAAGLFNQPGGGTAFANAIEAPVTLNKDIVIIDSPPAPVVPDREICSGDSRTLSVSTPLGVGFVYRWFSNSTLTTQVGTGNTFTPSTAQAPAGQVTHFWVTVESTGPGNCVSPPTEVRLFRRPALTTPSPISGPVNLCPNSTYTFSLPSAPPTITLTDPTPDPDVTRATTHVWSVPGTWTINSGQGTQSITITTGATTGAGTVSVSNQYAVAPTCVATATTLGVNVRARPTVNITPDPANICQGSTIQLNGNPVLPASATGFTPTVSIHDWTGSTVILDATNIQQPTVQASTAAGTYNLSYQVTANFGGGVFCTSTVDNSVVNVSANPSLANAGPDQTLCFPAGPLLATLAGSSPGVGTGTWTRQSGPGTITFANVNAPGTTATASLNGIYVLRWTVINGACSSFDEVQIDYGTAPGTPNAGIDQDVCGVTTTLNGSTPTFETGTWSQVSGPGTTTFTPNANTRNATATATVAGTYVYRWRYTSGTCAATQDDMQVIYRIPPTVSGPANFTSCLNSPQTAAFDVNLSGTFGGGAGSARWVVVTGSGTFSSSTTATGNFDVTSPATDVYRPSAADFTAGSVVLRLESDDPTGACTSVNDPVTITFDRLPTANAGLDQSICTSSTPLAATAANFGGTGTWTFPVGVTVSNVNSPTATVSNLPDATATTLRWTVTSALGVCAPVFDEVIITRNALPALTDAGLAATPLCEDAPAGGVVEATVTPAYLSSFNDNITGIPSSTNRSVEFFVNAGLTIPYTAPAAYQNNQTVFVRVRRTDVAPQCERTGLFTVRVNPKPVTVNLDGTPLPDKGVIQFCEDNILTPGQATNVNLTVFNGQITSGEGFTFTWHTTQADADNDVNSIAANSTTVTNATPNYFVRVENNTTGCFNTAAVVANVRALPAANPIVGSASRCAGLTPPDQGFYFISPGADRDYQWTVPAVFTNVGGVTTNFNVFLEFPNVVNPAQNISVVERIRYSTGYTTIPLYDASGILRCTGAPNTFAITANASPAPIVIVGDFDLCENDVFTYEATPSNAPISSYDWEIDPPTAASIIVVPNTNRAQVSASTTNFQIKVKEVSASCTGPQASQVITVNPRPTLTPASGTICSDDPASGITLAVTNPASFPGATFNITNVNVQPGLVPPTRATVSGGASTVLFNDTFNNLTGGNLVVSYTVEPVSTSGCAGASAIVQLTVRPEPVLQAGLFDEICSTTETVEVILGLSSGSSPADQYVVESINPNGLTALAGNPVTGTFTSTSFLIDDRWENKTGASVDVIYNIKPRNSGTTCIGDPAVPVTVRVKPEPIVTPLPTNIICSGDSPTVTLAATPAVGNNFAWSIGSITGLVLGASSGNGTVNIPDILVNNTGATASVVYSVRATLNGCVSASQNVRVDINPAPTANDITQTICSDAAGGNNAVISLTALQNTVNSGGGITFSWFEDLALSTSIATPGSYTIFNGDPVFVNVDNGQCTKVAQVLYTINPTPQVLTAKTLAYNSFDVRCTGSADGQITATPSLGTGPYLFSIDAGASFFTSNVFNGLSAAGGPYVIRVRDFNGCIANSTPLTINDPPALTLSAVRSLDYNGADVSCQAAANGQITATPVGGTGFGFTFQILELPGNTTGNTDGIYDNLRAGTYTIVARDANDCQATASAVTLNDPSAILPTAVLTTPVSCNGLNDGVITVTATGGTESGTYIFTLVQPPATSNSTGIISGLGAGTYTIRVQDDNNCFAISNPVNVTQPSPLTAFASVTSNYNGSKISCFGANDAQVTATPNGGNGGYTFLLVQGTSNTGDSDGSYENLPPGNYSIIVEDAIGCTVTTALVNVAEPAQLVASTLITNNISCFGGSDGEITVFGTGGTGAYTFERVALPTNISNTSGVFGGLADGTYNFNVRDLNLCLGSTSRILVQPTQVAASATVDTPYNGTQISCNGASDGIIRVSGTGGTGSYLFKVKEPGPTGITFNSLSGVFNNLRAGIGYEYTVTDIEGCADSDFIDIEEPDAVTGTASIVFPPAFNGQAIRCFGESNASVNIVGGGGVGSITGVFNFTYTITELPLNNSGFNSGAFTSLPAGTFNATVRDANGCPFAVAPFVITPPTQLQISGTVTSNYFGQQISCFGEDDGIITATASGGVTAYTYELLLAPGGTIVGAPQASTVFNGSIPANTYQIKLTDANGCERTSANIVVSQPTQITATASLVKGIDCFGDNNAIIRITRSGGTVGNAVYTFTNPPTPAPTPPSASTGTTATFFEFTNVSFGTGFGFTVTDVNNCTSPTSNLIDVLEPPQLVVTAVKRSPYNGGRDISCFGAKDGIVDVTSVGGTGTVEFKFDQDSGITTGQTSGVFTGLDVYPAPGLTFTGEDDNGCLATSNPVLLIQPDPINTTAAGSAINNANRGGFDISCFNGNNGTLEVAIPLSGEFGGTPAYTYTLLENPINTTGESNGVFTGLRAGNYRVRIVDVNNCSFITPTAALTQPTRLTVTAVKQSPYNGFDVSCDVATDGRLTITTTTGGVPAYSYQLFREGISTPEVIAGNVFNNLATNLSYTVVVTDLNDCTAESLPIILIPPTPLFSGVVFGDKSRCESGNNSDVTNPFLVTPPSGGIGNYTFEWIRLSDNAVVATTATIDPDAFLNFTPGATTPQVVSFIRRVTSSLGPGAPAPCQIADSPEPVTVTVNPLPVADFKLSDPLNDVICPGSTVLLDANFTVGTEPYRFEFTEVRSTTPTPTTTNFNRLGGDNNQLFFSTINENRRWTLTRVEDNNKCVITPNLVAETEVIQISANFTVVTPSPICSGEAYDFQFNANQNILYEWAWPTGLTEAQGPFATNGVQTQTETFVNTSFSSASNLPVTLTATYNDPANPTEVCSVTSTKIVRVKPNLNAQIVVDKPEICSESSVLVNNLSLGVGTHTWTVTDQNGDRPTSPELENGLGASVLNPDPLPTAISSRSYKFETEEGDANPKVYTIQYDIVNTSEGVTCSATTQAVVTVYRKAIADFEFASNPILWSFGVNADAIIINNTSGNAADDIPDTAFEYNWNFDRDATPETSTTTDKTFTVNYAQFGQREVSLTVLNPNAPISLERCQTSIRKVLVINVAPIFADFNLTPINSCLPTTLEVNYDDILQPAGTSFTWELFFIDNITGLPSRIAESSEFKPAFSVSKAGAYRLELVVRNSITNEETNPVVKTSTVYPNPVANFDFRQTVVFVPDTELKVINLSRDGNIYEWDFGDGTQYFSFEPVHKYRVEGTYPINLKVGRDYGVKDFDGDGTNDGNLICYDEITKEILAKDGGITRIPNSFTPSTNGPNGGNSGTGSLNDVFLPITEGVEEFQMQIFDRWGNLVFESRDKNQGWDGYDRNGNALPSGVYVYKLVLRLSNGERTTRVGDVTLIR
jgi:gliding motility-associated-like protein